MSHVAVLGAGAWGTALACLLGERGERVVLWSWQAQHAEALRRDRENREFFPGFPIPAAVLPTADLAEALTGAEMVLLVLPSEAVRSTLQRGAPHWPRRALVVSATKGIENGTLNLMTEVVESVLGAEVSPLVAALSGPSFAKEVALGMPTNVVVAGRDDRTTNAIQRRLGSERFRVYTSDDLVGVQLGGALKNVIAIAVGACDAMKFGDNSRAALITRGIAEMTRLAVHCGGNPLTLAGLAGVGDLVLTCIGDLSRNRSVGLELGRGASLDEVLARLGHVAEGVVTARSAKLLADRVGVEMPITNQVYCVLFENKPPREAVRDLAGRPLRRELD